MAHVRTLEMRKGQACNVPMKTGSLDSKLELPTRLLTANVMERIALWGMHRIGWERPTR